MATDRRRINPPPPGGSSSTSAPTYCRILRDGEQPVVEGRVRQREADQLRRIFLQTQTIPTATGSAYLELAPSSLSSAAPSPSSLPPNASKFSTIPHPHPPATLKLSSTIHVAPLPQSRNTPFAPNAVLNTTVKFSPFATSSRRSRAAAAGLERELGARLETAMSGVILGERWSKMNVVVGVLVLETDLLDLDNLMADADGAGGLSAGAGLMRGLGSGSRDKPTLEAAITSGGAGDEADLSIAEVTLRNDGGASSSSSTADWALMSLLSGCITVASAALADAGIDCVDLPAGGVAAIVANPSSPGLSSNPGSATSSTPSSYSIVLDPHPSEHPFIHSACMVSYLPARDEITDTWIRGDPLALMPGRGSASVHLPAGLFGGENGSAGAMEVDGGGEVAKSSSAAAAASSMPLEDLVNAACAAALGARSVLQDALVVATGASAD